MAPPIEFGPQFGVEFEMVVKNIWAHFGCLGTEESKVFATMASRLTAGSGQAVRSALENRSNEGDRLEDSYPDDVWTITQDASIREFSKSSDKEQHSPKSRRNRTSLELVSPVLSWDPDRRHNLECIVNFVRDTWHPVTNDTTGFHVHIGNDVVPLGQLPFTFEQIKQLAKMLTLCEGVIDKFHPPGRAGREMEDSDYTLSNVANPFFATCKTPLECIQKLENYVRSVQGVIDCMNREPDVQGDTGSTKRYYKVNFASLFKHGSIEFRQHQGELRYDRIELWISFLVDFVRASIAMTNAEIERLAENPMTLDVLVNDIVKDEKYSKLVWKEYMKETSVEVKNHVASRKQQRKEKHKKQENARFQEKLAEPQTSEERGDADETKNAGRSMLKSIRKHDTPNKTPEESALSPEVIKKEQMLSKVRPSTHSSQNSGYLRGHSSGSEPPTSDGGDANGSSDEAEAEKARKLLWPSSGNEPPREKRMEDEDVFAM